MDETKNLNEGDLEAIKTTVALSDQLNASAAPITFEEEELLFEAFKHGATIKQACLHSRASYDRVMAWLAEGNRNREIEELRLTPIWWATMKVAGDTQLSSDAARWYLTHNRESKAEWGDRMEHTGKDGEPLYPEEKKKAISDAIDQL